MVTSWRRMTSRFRHGLGTAGPPRPLQADTPVTWVTKVNNEVGYRTSYGRFPKRENRTTAICKSTLAQIITSVTFSNRRSTRCRRSSAPPPPPRRCRYLLRRCAWSRTKGNPRTTDARPVAQFELQQSVKSALAQIITSVTLSNRRPTRCWRSSAPPPPPRRYRYLLRRCAWSRTKGNPQTTDARPVAQFELQQSARARWPKSLPQSP